MRADPVPKLCEFCPRAVDRSVESPPVDELTHHVDVRADKAEAPVRLLVVDDEPHIADLVATVAKYEGWHARVANNGSDALSEAASFNPDIVVLDLMLPDLDGFTVLDRLRSSGAMVPVVFLTAKDATADRVAGLTRGGDDYLVKPFAVEDLELDEDTREVRRGETNVSLTPTEFELLRYLMRRSPAVLTKAQILDHVWDYDFGGRSNVVELVISHLRRKIDTDNEPLIHTIRGVGYVVRKAT
jgi:two-component system OmpR family response regulator